MAESCAPLSIIAGGYQDEFVESIPDILSCSICFLPFRDPHLVSCCGAKFCEPCIERVKSAGQSCPLCRKQEFISLLDRSLQRKVLEMKVRCSRKKDGCQWMGELRHLVPHEKEECVWAVIECSYQCGAHLPRRLMDVHQLDECPQRPIDAKLESFTRRMETKLVIEREQHVREMKEIKSAMETKLTALRDQHKLEMKRLESKLTAEKEQHERQMETRLTTESERYEKELVAVKETIEKIKV